MFKRTSLLVVVALAAALMVGGINCGGGSSGGGGGGGTSSSVTLSGKLNIVGSSSSAKLMSTGDMSTMARTFAVDMTTYKVSCVTLEDSPQSCGSACDSSGNYTVTCTGFAGKPFGCFIYKMASGSISKIFPVTFNVTGEGENGTVVSNNGLSGSITLDVDTGSATAEVTRTVAETPTSTAATLAEVANVDGQYTMTAVPYATATSYYTADQRTQLAALGGETVYNQVISHMNNQALMLKAQQASNNDIYLNVWSSTAARAACGNVETGFVWKFSDGTNNVALDIANNNSSTDSQTLLSYMGGRMDAVITQWFGALNSLKTATDGSDTATAVNCKKVIDLDGNFWNTTAEQITACTSAGSSCSGLANDPQAAVNSYKWKMVYDGTNTGGGATDTIIGLDLRNKTTTTALVYGYFTWSNGTQTFVDLGTTYQSSWEVDIGGCINWRTNEPPEVIEVGKYVQSMGSVCKSSEKRLLKQDSSGYLTVRGQKYYEVQSVTNDSNHKMVWTQVCKIDKSSGGSIYQAYPVNKSTADITSEYSNRNSGMDAKGFLYEAVYKMIAELQKDTISNSSSFYYWTNSGSGTVTCSELKSPTNAAQTADKMGSIWKNHNSYEFMRAFSCFLLGIHAGAYDALIGSFPFSNSDVTTIKGATWADANSNNIPDIIDNIASHSCIPQFQITNLCSGNGMCQTKIICSDMGDVNGGCVTGAEPASRMAHMKTNKIGTGKFQWFQREENYWVNFNSEARTSKICTQTNRMTIQNTEALTSAIATGGSFVMAMARTEKQFCEGETSTDSKDFTIPFFVTFTKTGSL